MDFALPTTLNFTMQEGILKTAFLICLTLLVAIIVAALLKSFIKVPQHFDTRRARSYVAFTHHIVTIVVFSIAAYFILSFLKVDLTPLLASAAVIGVVIGISSRSIIEDILSGLFLLSLDSLAIGDYIKIDDTPGDPNLSEGIVEKIGIRTITLRSYVDGALYVIPNGRVKKFINLSRPQTSVQLRLTLNADQDIDRVLHAANNALTQLQKDEELGKYVLPTSQINGVEDFQTFGHLVIRVSIFTSPIKRLEVSNQYRYLVKKEFEKHKIKIGS